MTKLSKKDRQRIIEILESEEELPLDYKHILFPPERKEYELYSTPPKIELFGGRVIVHFYIQSGTF